MFKGQIYASYMFSDLRGDVGAFQDAQFRPFKICFTRFLIRISYEMKGLAAVEVKNELEN